MSVLLVVFKRDILLVSLIIFTCYILAFDLGCRIESRHLSVIEWVWDRDICGTRDEHDASTLEAVSGAR